MSLFYASPSEDNLNVCESTSPAYGLDTADSSVGFLEGNHTQSPTERIRIIRKRMRSGKHKYSVRKPESTVGVDATARAFAQSLKVNEIFSHDDDRAAADDNTATTNTVHDREAMATPPPAKRAAIEGMDQHFSTYKPGELSPLPTPGRNHAAARSYHSSLDNPPFLPMGDRQGLEVPCLGHRSLTTDDMPSVTARSPKVPSSLLDNYPQQANASYMYRIRPNFASVWLRDLVNEKAERSKQDQEVGNANILGLPFAPPLFQQSRRIEHHVLPEHRQQEEEDGSPPKVAADMAVAPLPPTMGCFERANAA